MLDRGGYDVIVIDQRVAAKAEIDLAALARASHVVIARAIGPPAAGPPHGVRCVDKFELADVLRDLWRRDR